MKYIRNFTIIAHIDHGKSTLADCMMRMSGVSFRNAQDRVLDNMDLEREKGITIKSQTVRLKYLYQGDEYILNLIDTPGHVDFNYEVQRSLYACEGSILLVDATSGIQAQTLKNAMLAIEANHSIIIAVNKIDMPNADVVTVKQQISDLIGIDRYCEISAKTGEGVEKLFQHIIEGIHPPQSESDDFRGFVLDSWYDKYMGIIILARILDGKLYTGSEIQIINESPTVCNASEIGYLLPAQSETDNISSGDIAYIVTRMRNAISIGIGDTICLSHQTVKNVFDDFIKTKQSVFSIITPIEDTVFDDLQQAASQLRLNDASFIFTRHNSHLLGTGLRCGFLGLLHMEVIVERLKRDFNLAIIVTAPSVAYKVEMNNGQVIEINDPSSWPETFNIAKVFEPFVNTTILTQLQHLGGIIELCKSKRGVQKTLESVGNNTMIVKYDMPLSAIITDFHDKLQSITQGYGSFDYDERHYVESRMVKIDIKVNHEIVDAFSVITHADTANQDGRNMCERLAKLIPRHQFNIPVQAVMNGAKIIGRADVRPYRKDVTAKCYGGDHTRKMKLLNKQKKGKDRMLKSGKVNIPDKAILDFIRSE